MPRLPCTVKKLSTGWMEGYTDAVASTPLITWMIGRATPEGLLKVMVLVTVPVLEHTSEGLVLLAITVTSKLLPSTAVSAASS